MICDGIVSSAVWCIAYATALLYKFKPEAISYCVGELDTHMHEMINEQFIQHFPFTFCPVKSVEHRLIMKM